MNTKIWMAVLALCAGAVQAQLTSPISGAQPLPGAPKAVPKAAPKDAPQTAPKAAAAASSTVAGVPAGQGAGVHSPNSPFAPLPDRGDVVPWSVLTDIKTKTDKNKITPVYTMGQMALNQKTQKVQGFMMPLEPGEKQRHFLLTSVPMSCGFCVPGGPESMIEVRTKTPVKYTLEPVVVEGKFLVLNDDPYGLYYRITDASSVK
jgi:uncharacterized protein